MKKTNSWLADFQQIRNFRILKILRYTSLLLILNVYQIYATDFKYVTNTEVISHDEDSDGLAQPSQPVNGIVTDKTGMPVLGVSVLVKGTSQGTITDAKGQYSFTSVPSDAVLVFSFVGMKTMEMTVAGQNTINISMEEELVGIEEVVAIGYGTMKKSNVSGAITSLRGTELQTTVTTNVIYALQGKAPIYVAKNEGEPGAPATIFIRGVGSMRNSNPLWVVDGVKDAPLENLNDIESVQILKDAASTAIYGVEGANGVILVTTSRGKAGKPKVNYGFYVKSLSILNPYTMLSTPQYIDKYMERWQSNNPTIDDPTGYVKDVYLWPDSEIAKLPSTDWADVMTSTGLEKVHTLSVSGGTDRLGYNISFLHEYDKGTWANSSFSKKNIKVDFSQRINEWFKISESFNYTYSKSFGVQEWSQTWRATPMMEPYGDNPMGTGYGYITDEFFQDLEWQGWNPLEVADLRDTWTKNDKFWGNFNIELTPLNGLSWITNISGTLHNRWYEDFRYDNYGGISINSAAFTLGKPGYWNQFEYNKTNNRGYFINSYVSYSKTYGVHDISLMGGGEVFESSYHGALGYCTFGIPSEDLRVATMGSSYYATNNLGDDSGFSFFGRFTYAFKNKYLLTATARDDGSSKFAPGKRMAFFPAMSVAWNIANEFTFDKINDLKLRIGYGLSGNDDVPPNLWRQEYQQTVAAGPWQALRVVNEDITWEKTATTNIGVDIGIWQNALVGSIDVYDKLTTDALIQIAIPATTGYSTYYTNAGEIENRGVEISLGIKRSINAVNLSFTGNFAYNKNTVNSIGNAQYLAGGTYNRTYAGHPVSTIFGYVADGLYRTQAEIDALNATAVQNGFASYDGSIAPGDLKFRDIDGNGTITGDDQAIIGNPWPMFVYGFNIGASYKSFDFFMNWNGVSDIDVYNGTLMYLENLYSDYNASTETLNAWSELNPDASIPRLGNGAHNFQRVTSYSVEDASYLKLKNLQLGYNFSKSLISKIKLQNLRLYFAVENALTFSKFKGYDPEFIAGDNYTRGVYDYNIYPQARAYVFGLQVGL